MKYDHKMIRDAIKERIKRDNEFNLYGRYPSTRWDAPLPEHHFYFRNKGLTLRVYDTYGEVTDSDGTVVARYERKWGTKKVCLTYRELVPSIEWME